MGYNIHLVTFNCDIFEKQIKPAFREGETNSLVQETAEWLSEHARIFDSIYVSKRPDYLGLGELITTSFDEDLSVSSHGKGFVVINGKAESGGIGIRFDRNTTWIHEDFANLFQAMIFRKAIHHYLNLGRKNHIGYFLDRISPDIQNFPNILHAINRLEESHRFYLLDGGMTGILNTEDTELFHNDLKLITLRETISEHDSLTFDFLLKITETAVAQKLGLLLGQDLPITVEGYRHSPYKLILTSHISGDGCPYFKSEPI
ncbi:hypothetical protein D3C87_64610 [compost metagenome]